jgi:hypothetical protein
MNSSDFLSTSTPTKVLFAFTFLHQFVAVMYASLGIEHLPLYEVLGWLASYWIICWWLIEDSKRTGTRWPLDLGYFLLAAWFLILPYHLFRTRGTKKALIGILAYTGVILVGWLLAVFGRVFVF